MIERAVEISPTSVKLTIAEGKALLASLQEQTVTAQVQRHSSLVHDAPVRFARRGLPFHSAFGVRRSGHANPATLCVP